jgi:MFS transporter, FHS family, glucose/mannose:H+ symporter
MYKKNLVFAAACLGMLLFGIGLITLGSVAPDLREKFQLNEISSGTLFFILALGILTGSLLFGPVCDRFGYKLLLVLSCLFMFAGFEGIAWSPGLGLLKISIYIFGVSGGCLNGATNAVVADISTETKTANLSLLGVFFGIGALGTPFVLGSVKNIFSFSQVIAVVGLFTFTVGVFYAFIQFPPSKKAQGFPLFGNTNLFNDNVLILIAFFLFCQSSFEAIISNWTTSYLTSQLQVTASNALYALTLYVIGMTVMRLLTGSVFRFVSPVKMLLASLGILFLGILFLHFGKTFSLAITGLILIGAGLAGGFPIMLGFVGTRYVERSGTAFSFVLVIALIGNMLVNYMMGLIAHTFGIQYLTTVAFAEIGIMLLLSIFIFRRINRQL